MLESDGWYVGKKVGTVEIVKPQPVATDGRELRWYILVTEPRREPRAVDGIAELGLTAYWPRLHKRTPAGRRRSREIEVSMYPSRILVQMPDTDEAFWRVYSAPGVVDFVRMSDGRHLATLPDREVREIRKVEAQKDSRYRNLLLKAEASPYRPGRNVWAEIIPGRKMYGQIIDQDGQGRVNVRIAERVFDRDVWPVKTHLLQFADDMPKKEKKNKFRKVTPTGIAATV